MQVTYLKCVCFQVTGQWTGLYATVPMLECVHLHLSLLPDNSTFKWTYHGQIILTNQESEMNGLATPDTPGAFKITSLGAGQSKWNTQNFRNFCLQYLKREEGEFS